MKKLRKSKEEEYFIILEKLLKKSPLMRPDFERPKFKSKTFASPESVPKKDSFVPHSTLISRLNELREMEAIKEFESGLKSKKNLPRMEYDISVLGVVKLLQLCDEKKFLPNILPNIYRLSTIWFFMKPLIKMFSIYQIFETLVHVCKNTRIEIDKDPIKSGLGKYPIPLTNAWDLLKGENGIKAYFVETKIDQIHSSYLLRDKFLSYGEKSKGKIIFSNIKPILEINKIITAMFFHEFIFRCSNSHYFIKQYMPRGKKYLIQMINSDKELKPTYSNFLQKIKNQQDREIEFLSEIKDKII